MNTHKVKWVLAHEPIELFLRVATRFSKEVFDKTNGKIDIEILTLSQYSAKYNDGKKVSKLELLDLMETGKIEMSQMYTTSLGRLDKNMFALDMPFLFRDHGHATKVLEGSIGQSLMKGLEEKTNIKGLAFTYSGGYRMIAAKKPIQSIEDFQGLKIRIAKSPVAKDLLEAVGAIPVPMELEEVNDAIATDIVEGGESTYPRFYSMKQNEVSSCINDTKHSLFLTSIIINKNFWASLPTETQEFMQKAAVSAAQLERQESVEDVAVIQERCKKDGIPVVTLAPQEEERFKAKVESVYKKYENFFDGNIVQKIRNTH